MDLHEWAFATRTFRRTVAGADGGTTGVDDDFAARGFRNVTIRQYLRAKLIDELHVVIAPVLLGGGERLFEGIDLRASGYECVQFVASENVAHIVLQHRRCNSA